MAGKAGMHKKQYYVYQLIDPRDDKPFYIGKGKGNRMFAHEAEAKKGSNHPKCILIREIQNSGLSIKKTIVKHFSNEDDAFDYEAKLIKDIGRKNLKNCTDGGRNPLNFEVADPQKIKDSNMLEVLMFLFRKTNGYTPEVYNYLGSKINLSSNFFEKMKEHILSIYQRQGVDFVNRHCKKHNIIINFVSKVENGTC